MVLASIFASGALLLCGAILSILTTCTQKSITLEIARSYSMQFLYSIALEEFGSMIEAAIGFHIKMWIWHMTEEK